ncbi:MAG: response regulator [Spirobacillus cienkowskii]|jgi:two-component system chemotaxis response regulator CheV|uniref:Response regulator n=1 Tax=Spirobacillus cienkowskii TaxID=495820 RepID=A0A369KSH8_9BACT|nr:MAG: response regulator [Spirobacillus cienkowskii]
MAIYIAKSKKEERMLQIGSNKFELVDFRLKDYPEGADMLHPDAYEGIYGINIAKVREINKISKFTKMPNTHECIEGLLELREEAIPIVNLAKYLGYKNYALRPTDNVIICEFNGLVTGFVVHQAMKIRRISWEAILPPTRLIGREGGCVTGMHKLVKGPDNERDLMLLILDFEKIVAEINGETDALNKFSADKQSNKIPGNTDDSRTILVVDDSSTARTQVELFLTQHGYKVITATDCEEGLFTLNALFDQAKQEDKDITDLVQVVISDVEMPRMDGHAFTQSLKKDPKFNALPVIMHTSLSGRANQDAGKSLADEYVVKFNGEALLATVNRIWRKLMDKKESNRTSELSDSDEDLAS